MYPQSVPALISKNVGNTLSNYKSWGGIVYNVKEYGAAGDGSTDDTAVIQAAITAISTAGKGILWFPTGGTYLTTKLSGVSNMTVMGYGAVLKLANATNNTMLEFASKSNVRVFGLEFDGNKANQTIFGPLIGLYFIDCSDVHVEDCIVHDVYGIGYGANCTNRGNWKNNKSFNNANNGFDWNGDFTTIARVNQGNTYMEIAGNTSYSNGSEGIFFGHGICKFNNIHHNRCYSNAGSGMLMGESSSSLTASNSFSQNIIESNILTSNTLSGLTCFIPRNNKFIKNICNDNGSQGLRLSRVDAGQPFPKDNQVQGNECSNISTANQTYGILIDGAGDSNEIKDNTCLGNTTANISRSGASDVVYQNRVTGGYQRKTGTVTSASIAANGEESIVVPLTGYTITPDVLVSVLDTTGHELFTAHATVITNASFTIRINNNSATTAGTAAVRWVTDGGI